ncbi:AAA family ATPase [Methanopyrus sp.]
MLICVVGMPGAGKGEFVKVAREEGVPVVVMGDAVRREAERRGMDVGEMAKRLREERGMDAVARLVVEDVERELRRAGIVVIDGIRNPEELEYFRNRFGERSVIVVAIHASPQTRFERLRGRGREDDPNTKREFEERDERELGFGIGDVISRADVMIVNESVSLPEFREKCRMVIKAILRGDPDDLPGNFNHLRIPD